MNDALLEWLINQGEGTSLDFKRDQYPFTGAGDSEKSELLKDVLAFANAWRSTDAFILIGVEEVTGGRGNIVGVANHLADASLQQFVNIKVQRPLAFSYEAYPAKGVQIGIIHIPIQERPFSIKKDYGKLVRETVYIRRGSSTDIASLDEIAKMGLARQEELNTYLELQALLDELDFFLKESVNINFQEKRAAFVYDQYQRLFEKGVIVRLDERLRSMLRDAYSEIKALDRIVSAAWSSGRGGNTWAEGVNEAGHRRIEAKTRAITAHAELRKYLESFGV